MTPRAPKLLLFFALIIMEVFWQSSAFAAVMAANAWALPSSYQNKTSQIFVTLQNMGPSDDALTGVGISQAVQVYLAAPTTEVVNGVAAQRFVPIRDLALPAGQSQTLSPNGVRIVAIGLRQVLFTGEEFPITLHFVRNPPITLLAKVAQAGATMPPH